MKNLVILYTTIFVVLAFSATSVFGQSEPDAPLIRNESFEELTFSSGPYPCPNSPGEIFKSLGWDKAFGSVDFYHSCSNDSFPDYGTPSNFNGLQDPLTGEAYALIACYADVYDDAKEYLVTGLNEELKEGKSYHLQFYVSLGDNSNFAVTNIGGYFSAETTKGLPRNDFFEFSPQVEHDSVAPLTDKENWFRISGTFTADGGERFLTIGCFRRDSEDNIQRVSSDLLDYWDVSGYYIDDVSLTDLGYVGIDDSETSEFSVHPNPVLRDGFLSLNRASGIVSTKQFIIYDMVGKEVGRKTMYFSSSIQIDMSEFGLKSGHYIYQLIADTGVYSNHLVVE